MTTIKPTKPRSYVRSLATKLFSEPIAWLRDLIAAKILAPAGITPNMLTIAGLIFSLIGAWLLATGAEQTWETTETPNSYWAAWCFIFACAMDMLDGALAREGNMGTKFGGILDSCIDRLSDMAIFGAIALSYARLGNITFAFLSMIALSHAVMTSYIKSRAECTLPPYTIGFWQRGERLFAVLVACFSANVHTLIWMMAILPAFTAYYRLWFVSKQANDPTFRLSQPDRAEFR